MAKGKNKLYTKLRLSELSLVDDPANEQAEVTIFKRRDPTLKDVLKYAGDLAYSARTGAKSFSEILERAEAQRRQWQASEVLWPLFNALRESLESIASDENVTDKAGKIQASVDDFMAAVKEKLPDVEEELEKALSDPALAGLLNPTTEGENMSDIEKKVTQLEGQVTDLTKQLETSTALVTTLQTQIAEKDTAIADVTKKLEDANKAIDVAKGDETLKVGDVEIKKSAVGESTFNAMKAQQAQIEKGNEERQLLELEKRATKDFGVLPGESIAKAKVLLAVSKMSEEDRKAIEAMLSAGNKALSDLTKSTGSDGGSNDGDSAEDRLTAAVEKYATEKKVSKEKAYAEFLETKEGRDLYAATKVEKSGRSRAA